MREVSIKLADGRSLTYFGERPARPHDYPDRRDLPVVHVTSEARCDQVLDEWVVIASHRQDRTFQPSDDQCPLCPSSPGHLTEIPAPEYDVVVFDNRFPTLRDPGHCDVVVFSDDHNASFADLTTAQARIVMAAWVDRSAALAARPDVEQVYCFENRGAEIGVTLSHPHGQIYAYPFVTPRTSRMLHNAARHRLATGRNLFDDAVAREVAEADRVVLNGEHWVGFVPYAAHWPYEVHLYPRQRVPDLATLPEAARDEFCVLYLDLLGRFDRLFGVPAPYISAWHQAPVRGASEEFALHLELFTIRRAANKLKYLAGSESGMGAFANDIAPEAAAQRLRELA
ncbi:MAG TPA: galactose-1-phosphate uridylyltransferase [Streptosporangiaceae bacterium]|nr:galactose-1-phosphate uridylyltransferase [Streptosporangiaceae bacterium]